MIKIEVKTLINPEPKSDSFRLDIKYVNEETPCFIYEQLYAQLAGWA